MQFTDRKTHFTDCIPLLLIPNYKVRTDRHMAYTYRYGAGVLDNPQTSAFGLFKKISNCKFRMKRVDFFFSSKSTAITILPKIPLPSKARFKRRANAVPNSIDRIKFDFSTAVARRLKPSRATVVPNSIHKF